MKVSQYIRKFLQEKQIKHVFGYSGGAILPLLNEFHKKHNSMIHFIKNSTELCSGFSAEGYTKSLGKIKPGIIVSTSGPGVTNIITPLQNAYNDGIPILAITAQVPTKSIGTDAFQECKATELTKPCTKHSYFIDNKNDIVSILNIAYNQSLEPRMGPVHIDIPKDILLETINDEYINGNYIKKETIQKGANIFINNIIKKPSYSHWASIIRSIYKSKKPIVIAGQGCHHSSKELTKFIETYQLPITTTLHGVGNVDESNPLSLEMLGMHGNPVANYAIQNADFIIAIGTRFDDRTTGILSEYGKNALNNEGIVHVDSSYTQLQKVKKLFNNPLLRSIYSDSNHFLKQMNCNKLKFQSAIPEKNNLYTDLLTNDTNEWLNELNKYQNIHKYNYHSSEELKGPDVLRSLNYYLEKLELNKDMYITTGVGNHQMWTSQYIQWKHPNQLITSGSLGTMGVGIPYAIGTKLANPNSLVICVDGDGSFNMTSNDLQTILENRIPIKIIIMNDSRQQMVYVWQELFHENNIIGTENINPDYNQLADAYNITNYKCDSKENISKIMYEFLNETGPVLLNCIIKPEMCYPLVAPGKALDEMIFTRNDLSCINTQLNSPN